MPPHATIELSIIITTTQGEAVLERCLQRLIPQTASHAIEILVPNDANTGVSRRLQEAYPQVRFISMGHVMTQDPPGTPGAVHEVYDRMKSCGLCAARGEILALLDDAGAPAADWCEQTLLAHQLPYEVIGGAVEHSGSGGWNWAAYFQDFIRYGLPLAEGPTGYLTDVNIAYKRHSLEAIRPVWEERYHEVTVNWEIARCGGTLWRRPQMIVCMDRGKQTLSAQVRERFAWGQLFGVLRNRESSPLARLAYILSGPLMPALLMGRIFKKTLAAKRHRRNFLAALPHLVVSTSAWCLGEWMAYFRNGEGATS